jgi:hypothetical protein
MWWYIIIVTANASPGTMYRVFLCQDDLPPQPIGKGQTIRVDYC